jgi:TRAP transporter TAXI family solute receptor
MMIAGPSSSWSAPPNWPASLTIATGSPGGGYYPYGQELAAILTEAIGIPVLAQSTQGSDQNILLLESGHAQLGFTTMGIALQAWNGTDPWTHDKKLRSMRALFPMYDNPFEFVALNSSAIHSLADMAGNRVGAGPQGGTGATYAAKIFEALGIAATLRYGAWNTLSAQMQSGSLDALVGAVAVPFPALAELDETSKIRFIPLSGDETAKLRRAMPELSPSLLPKGSFPSLTTDYTTVGLFNFTVVSKDLPDDLVYAIVKAFYANHNRLVEAYPAARESVTENVKRDAFLPFHPGAVRYYREIGVEIPAALTDAQ